MIDRSTAVRRALRSLVAEHGFHGASMSAVAKRAGVATGTAYVHYASKEELVYATYLEIKRELADAIVAGVDVDPERDIDSDAEPADRWRQMMKAAYRHLSAEPERARFLTQLEESPYRVEAQCRLDEAGNPLQNLAAEPRLVRLLVRLPPEVLYALSFGVLVKLVAAGVNLSRAELDRLITATWRAVTVA